MGILKMNWPTISWMNVMATSTPLYGYGQVVYLRESAALGFIEPVKISGVHLGKDGWLYTINATLSPPSPGGFGDRRSLVNTQLLYYSEGEFVLVCDAYLLAEANAKLNYERIKTQRQALCPDNPTAGTG
jgi:hypothetical protein